MGLDVASIGASAIERAVRHRQHACQLPDVHAYWEHLRRSQAELQELIDAVVVPETWFFRDRESFAALARVVRDELLPANRRRAAAAAQRALRDRRGALLDRHDAAGRRRAGGTASRRGGRHLRAPAASTPGAACTARARFAARTCTSARVTSRAVAERISADRVRAPAGAVSARQPAVSGLPSRERRATTSSSAATC